MEMNVLHINASYVQETGEPQSYQVWGVYETTEDRDAVLAQFPKSLSLRKTTCGASPAISGWGTLKSNGVNGGRNEAGVKRFAKLIATGLVTWQKPCGNSYETMEQAAAAII